MDQKKSESPALKTYRQRLSEFQTQMDRLTRTANRLSRIRLSTVIIIVIALLLFFNIDHIPAAAVTAVFGLPVFVMLVLRHIRITSELARTRRMAEINRQAIARIDGDWRQFSDNGSEFSDDRHPYANDLDIFGPGSLFQWLNATGTYMGRKKLAQMLSNEKFDYHSAHVRRRAIAELAPLLDWRQGLFAKSLETNSYSKDPTHMVAWMNTGIMAESTRLLKWHWPIYTLAVPLLALLVYLFTGSYHLFTLWIPFNMVILLFRHKAAANILSHFDDHEQALCTYVDLLRHIEHQPFRSDSLGGYQNRLIADNGVTASKAIAQLRTLTSIGQVRYNSMLAAILNLIVIWDLQAAMLLELWKRKYGRCVEEWFEIIGEMEMLSSLSTLPFDNPDWCFPQIEEQGSRFEAEDMGHPLIEGRRRVCNDIRLGPKGSVLIITGSNMSGKTTLLRTIGINLVLAFCGAPVCAKNFACSPEQLLTSMRITDDLQNGISTFYAELLRIRFILNSACARPSIILIDEIFRGTNTHDRHAAAQHVLKYMTGLNAMTVISTHDLDLADLEEADPQNFRNFHFEDYYHDQAIHFDYRLRPGRSTESNAMRLLALVGVIPALN